MSLDPCSAAAVDSIAITYLTPSRFHSRPQEGLVVEQDWTSFARWLSWPTIAPDKRACGAWCPAALHGGAVKAGTGPVSLLVADVDVCERGAIDRSAAALRNYGGIVVPTFSATDEVPKHRIVLRLARPLSPDGEYSLAWSKMAADLEDAGILVDRGCKNVNRLYFACVVRPASRWLGARHLTGGPVDVDAMLAAAKTGEVPAGGPQTRAATAGLRYLAAALERARANVRAATDGSRHDTLLRESFSLARLDLTEAQVAAALLESFVGAAGEARRHEGERTIHDAVAARRGNP